MQSMLVLGMPVPEDCEACEPSVVQSQRTWEIKALEKGCDGVSKGNIQLGGDKQSSSKQEDRFPNDITIIQLWHYYIFNNSQSTGTTGAVYGNLGILCQKRMIWVMRMNSRSLRKNSSFSESFRVRYDQKVELMGTHTQETVEITGNLNVGKFMVRWMPTKSQFDSQIYTDRSS
jgi:hypothetical protein